VKQFLLALAVLTIFLTTTALPSLADGNPESKCFPMVCPPAE